MRSPSGVRSWRRSVCASTVQLGLGFTGDAAGVADCAQPIPGRTASAAPRFKAQNTRMADPVMGRDHNHSVENSYA
jgi:hypothetical protein